MPAVPPGSRLSVRAEGIASDRLVVLPYHLVPGTGPGAVRTSGCADWVEGDDLRFYPPLIITREQVDEAMDIIDASLTQLGQDLP